MHWSHHKQYIFLFSINYLTLSLINHSTSYGSVDSIIIFNLVVYTGRDPQKVFVHDSVPSRVATERVVKEKSEKIQE